MAAEQSTATQRTIPIAEASTEQLKAAAYDQIVQLRQLQNNITVLEQELAKRQEAETQSAAPDVAVIDDIVVADSVTD